MTSAAETIKERLGVVEVLGSYIKLEKSGGNYKACCPFHNEKTPSFFVSPGRASYYCFGCGAKGDIFTFVQEFEKVDFVGALKILAERAGIELAQFRDDKKGETDKLRAILDLATSFYQSELKKNPAAIKYLTGRGLTEKMIEEWRIGYAPNEWRKLHDYLLSKTAPGSSSGGKITDTEMEAVGLIKKSEKEGGRADVVYDRFRARVMFPMFDPSNRVVGYSGRIFGVDDSEGPKYLNSPETVLFSKSDILYGYNKAKEGIRQWGYAILVEGQMDLLMCHQSGYSNAVATSGTALTHMHLEKLKKISDNLVLVYDADKAGLKATLRAWTTALSLGMTVKVAGLPQGEDPASLIQKSKEEFKQALKNSKHIIDYYIDILSKEQLSKDQFTKAVQTEVLPYVAVIESAIERSNFISRVSAYANIHEADLREEVDKLRAEGVPKLLAKAQAEALSSSRTDLKNEYSNTVAGLTGSNTAGKKSFKGAEATERRIAGMVLWLNSKKVTKDVTESDVLENKNKAEQLIASVKNILSEEDMTRFESEINDPTPALIFEAEMLFDGSAKIDDEIEQLLEGLEERTLKEKLSHTMSELQIAENRADKDKIDELIKRCQDIASRLSDLNNKKSAREAT